MMKHIKRFHSQGSDTAHSSFPHRSNRKTTPSIASKMIPLHKIQINRGYKGSTVDMATFDHWAYVPPQINKKQIEKMYHEFHVKSRQKRKETYSLIEKHNDRSQLTLKKYLKRKQLTEGKNTMYYSQIINLKQKESLFSRTAGNTYFLFGQNQQEQAFSVQQPKKEHFKTRLKQSWMSKKQKIMEHLRERQSYNVTSTEFKKTQANQNDRLHPPRYTHLPRDSKGFLITQSIETDVQQFFNNQ